MVIETTVYSNSHELSQMLLGDIVMGAEPDPSLFQLPAGLKKVK